MYAAFKAAREHTGQPTVILAHTIKGWTLGKDFEARNATHQMKKLTVAELKEFRDRLYLPIPDSALEAELPPYYHPGEDSDEIQYMRERRAALGGVLPPRVVRAKPLPLPADSVYDELRKGSGKQAVATTMAFVRLLKELMKDPAIGERFAPIIPDEARTFGMDSLFPTAKIYSPHGQTYEAVDRNLLLSYKESEKGQILHEGISESGAMGSVIAAGTVVRHARHAHDPGVRVLLDVRLAADRRPDVGVRRPARAGFPARRDGRPDDAGRRGPAAQRRALAAARLGQRGVRVLRLRVGVRARLRHAGTRCAGCTRPPRSTRTARTSSTTSPSTTSRTRSPRSLRIPWRDRGLEEGILRGLYLYAPAAPAGAGPRAQILASGVALRQAMAAQEKLAADWGVTADVWSATSWTELRREALACESFNMLNPGEPSRVPYVTSVLADAPGPVVAVSDWIKAVPDQIARWVPGTFTSLGTDGFGFSDTRPAARRFFHVDAESVTVAVLWELARSGAVDASLPGQAIAKYQLDLPVSEALS